MSRSTAVSTGALASGSTTVVRSGASILNVITATTDGTNNATVTVYDNTAASGKVIAVVIVPGANLSRSTNFLPGLRCEIGMTVVVTGTGATAYVAHGGM